MKLIVFDVEGTLFKTQIRLPGTAFSSTIWQSIAQALGPDAINEEVNTHKKWKNGEYASYLEWVRDTIAIHKRYQLTESVFNDIIKHAKYNDGVIKTIKRIDRSKYELVAISGGFRELTIRIQRDLEIIHCFAACEYIFNNNGQIQMYNLLPCDFSGKFDFIQLMLREYQLSSKDWIFVGDGANDVPIAKLAPLSIGYNPHEQLRKVVTYTIENFEDILKIII